MTDWAWLLPALPALAAVVGLLLWRVIPGGAATPAVLGCGAALVVSLVLVASVESGDPARVHTHGVPWTPIDGIPLAVGTRVGGLAAIVAVMVSIVAFLVQVY